MPAAELRLATANDVDVLARLHARSWQESYRGAYSDAFLDSEALADRTAVWAERLGGLDLSSFTIVAEVNGVAAGFAYLILDEDPALGAVVQNLHVSKRFQRQGIGSGLMAEVARVVLDRRPSSGLHVWVRKQNEQAKAFYEACGGKPLDRKLGGPFADGSRAPVLCFAWPTPSTLLASP